MIYGILLAAGNSTRFGSNKLLQAYDAQYSLIQQSALSLRHALSNSIVIVRPNEPELIQQLAAIHMQTVICPKASTGMSASIACGIKHCPDANGWIIALADMPLVKTSTIQQIAQALESQEIVAPYYHERRGNPVGFSNKYRQQLLNLKGDKGARNLLTTYDARIHRINTDDKGIVCDIDTPDDMNNHLPSRG